MKGHRQYYVLNSNPSAGDILDFIQLNGLLYELHLNRIRFWLEEGSIQLTEFLLRYNDHCSRLE